MLNLHVLGTIRVDARSRAVSVTIHRVMDSKHGLGNVTGEIMLNTLLNHWIKYCGKPNIVRTDPDGAFRDQGFRRGLAAMSIRLDIDPGEASWRTGVLGKTLDTIKQSAVRVARRTPDSVTIQEIFDECIGAHNDLHRIRGFCPWQLLLGKTPTDKSVCENLDLAQCRSCGRSCRTASPCEGKVVQKCTSKRNCLFENAAKKFFKPDLGGTGQQVNLVLGTWQTRGFENEGWCFSWAGTCAASRTRNDR